MALRRDQLEGVFCAMVTPTRADGGVDREGTERLVEYLLDNGVTGLVPVGGTGEYTALTPAARREMTEVTVRAAAGRVPVVAGVLSPGYGEAVAAGLDLAAAGADALLVLTPFYATSTQERIREYFRRYAAAVPVPVLLYEIPSRTNVALDPATVEAMVDDGSIVGMKACNTSLSQFVGVMRRVGDQIAVMSGEEPFFATHVAMGATGGILATSNLVPRLWNAVQEAARGGDLRAAMARQGELGAFLDAVFAETNPGPLKAAMGIAGLAVGEALCPLGPPTPAVRARLEDLVPKVMARERALGGAKMRAAAAE